MGPRTEAAQGALISIYWVLSDWIHIAIYVHRSSSILNRISFYLPMSSNIDARLRLHMLSVTIMTLMTVHKMLPTSRLRSEWCRSLLQSCGPGLHGRAEAQYWPHSTITKHCIHLQMKTSHFLEEEKRVG